MAIPFLPKFSLRPKYPSTMPACRRLQHPGFILKSAEKRSVLISGGPSQIADRFVLKSAEKSLLLCTTDLSIISSNQSRSNQRRGEEKYMRYERRERTKTSTNWKGFHITKRNSPVSNGLLPFVVYLDQISSSNQSLGKNKTEKKKKRDLNDRESEKRNIT